jgi:predicted dinucleotide-binding enzyme
MDITIVGTGNIGRAIAARALAGGHEVALVGHEPGTA